jgi:glycine cleavage system H lipoate-binding protein
MVVIFVALTFFAAIIAGGMVAKAAKRREALRVELRRSQRHLSPVKAVHHSGRVPQFPEDVYYHMGHAWVKLEEGNTIRIGLDDFTQQLLGDLDGIEIPTPGGKLNQGDVGWKVRHGRRNLSQLAPLGGTVMEVNEKLKKDPTLANRSPYGEGWILKIQNKALNKEMPELMDSFQFKAYLDRCKANLMSSINNQALGLTYGDGEEVIKGVADNLDERTWKMVVAQLFHSSSE